MGAILSFFQSVHVFVWDGLLFLFNVFTPNLKAGHVVPRNHPGADGKWPEYIAPKEGDSRSACPALNALANHGIFPRDGRNITFKEMNQVVRTSYNFAPSFCFFVPNYSAQMLKRSYSKGTFDLADISLHNGIEHDGSLTREDVYRQPDQSKPHLPFVKELLDSASGKDKDGNPSLTIDDISRSLAHHRALSKATNPEYTTSTIHKVFGCMNSATLIRIFGGRVNDLQSILIDERIPDGWEPQVRSRKGLTMASFNVTAFLVESGTKRHAVAQIKDTTATNEMSEQQQNESP